MVWGLQDLEFRVKLVRGITATRDCCWETQRKQEFVSEEPLSLPQTQFIQTAKRVPKRVSKGGKALLGLKECLQRREQAGSLQPLWRGGLQAGRA